MTSTDIDSTGAWLRTGPVITGPVLVGAGSLLVLAGLAVGGSHLLTATRNWVRAMEVPPGELARLKWTQARAAAGAGASAWKDQSAAPRAVSS